MSPFSFFPCFGSKRGTRFFFVNIAAPWMAQGEIRDPALRDPLGPFVPTAEKSGKAGFVTVLIAVGLFKPGRPFSGPRPPFH